jgi:hypothetical protein
MTTPDDLPPEVLDAINAKFPDVLEVKRRARANSIVITVEGRPRYVTGTALVVGGTTLHVQCVDDHQFLWIATASGQSSRVVSEADGMAMIDFFRNRAIAEAFAACDCN